MTARVAFRVHESRTVSQTHKPSRDERGATAIVRRAIKRQNAIRDRHPEWFAEILRLEAEGHALDEKANAVFMGFNEAVDSGKLKVSKPCVTIGTDYGIDKIFSLYPRSAPKGWEGRGKPLIATTPCHIWDAENFMLSGLGIKSRKPDVLRKRRKIKSWGRRLQRELARQQKKYNAALSAFQDYGALNKKTGALFERRWILIDKCAFTPARTVAGCQAQAQLVAYLIEAGGGSNWTRQEDVRAAKNMVASLSRIAKGQR